MRAEFVVSGKPVGKGRPRMNRKTGRVYTPDKTLQAENAVKRAYYSQCRDVFFESYVRMELKLYYAIAKSNTKKIKEQKLLGELRPDIKPDIDNVIKLIADSLNGLAYKDDTQIIELEAKKYYSDNPRMEIVIQSIPSRN